MDILSLITWLTNKWYVLFNQGKIQSIKSYSVGKFMHIKLSITSSLSNKVIETFGIIDLISIFLWNTLQIAFFFYFTLNDNSLYPPKYTLDMKRNCKKKIKKNSKVFNSTLVCFKVVVTGVLSLVTTALFGMQFTLLKIKNQELK